MMSAPDLQERRRRLMENAPKMGHLLYAPRPEPKPPRFRISWRRLLLRTSIVMLVALIGLGGFLAYRSWQKDFLYETALKAQEAGDWGASRSALQSLTALDPDFKDAKLLLTETYYHPVVQALDAGQLDRALELVIELNQVNLAYKDIPDRVRAVPALQQALIKRYGELWLKGDVALVGEISGHWGGKVTGVAVSPDGRRVASAAGDNHARVWDLSTGKEIKALVGHQRFAQAVAFSPDGDVLATASWDNTVKLWDVAGGEDLHTLAGHEGIAWCVAYSPDGKTVASGSSDWTVRLWDAVGGRQMAVLNGHEDNVRAVAFSPDGFTLASGGEDGALRLWELPSGRLLRVLNPTDPDQDIMALAFSPGGDLLAVGRSDHVAVLLDTSTWEEVRVLRGNERHVMGVAFSPDGRVLATAGWDDSVRLWNVATGEEIALITRDFGVVQGVAFAPDGKVLVSGHGDTILRLWQPR